jgi:uncharacterized protein (TIGR03435 family)
MSTALAQGAMTIAGAGGFVIAAGFGVSNVAAQSPSAVSDTVRGGGTSPKYEVATIKPSADDNRSMMMFKPDGVSLHNIPMQMLLREAFRTEDDHILSVPAWAKTAHYDIEAKVSPEDAPKLTSMKANERQAMFVPLLIDRFSLKYHHETRELQTYSLVVAKDGVKLKESAPDAAPTVASDAAKDAPSDAPKQQPRGPMMRMQPGLIESEGGKIEFLAHVLSQQLRRTVVDKTGLTGDYRYKLQWAPDEAPMPMMGAPGGGPANESKSPDPVGPSLFTALEEQLGLKLESNKAQADVIVIDRLDLPSPN